MIVTQRPTRLKTLTPQRYSEMLHSSRWSLPHTMSSIDVPLHNGGFGHTVAQRHLVDRTPLSSSAFPPSSSTPPGPRCKATITPSAPTFHRSTPRSHDRANPAGGPPFLPFSAAMLILWAPGGFRFTCYYYRGAYYKAFWADPPSCTVGEPRKSYWGERTFPLIIQNIHRYFLYLALIFIVILAFDAIERMWFDGTFRHRHRHAGHDRQPDSARQLHARLPFAPASGRRTPGRNVEKARAQILLRLRVHSTAATCCGRG